MCGKRQQEQRERRTPGAGLQKSAEAPAAGAGQGGGSEAARRGEDSPEVSQRAVAAGSPRLSSRCPRGGAGGRVVKDWALVSRTQ